MNISERLIQTFSRNFSNGRCHQCEYDENECICAGRKSCISCIKKMYDEYTPTYNWCSYLREAYILKYFFVHVAC